MIGSFSCSLSIYGEGDERSESGEEKKKGNHPINQDGLPFVGLLLAGVNRPRPEGIIVVKTRDY